MFQDTFTLPFCLIEWIFHNELLELQSASTILRNSKFKMKREAGNLVHKVICSKLSKLGDTFALRVMNIVCHKEILGIMYQYVHTYQTIHCRQS